jgi:hypothetical protein
LLWCALMKPCSSAAEKRLMSVSYTHRWAGVAAPLLNGCG